jgi:hypothetical protein
MSATEHILSADSEPAPSPAEATTPLEGDRALDLSKLVERESQTLLGVSWEKAHEMLESGSLAGTAT